MRCDECADKACEQGRDCTGGVAPEAATATYKGDALRLLQAAAEVEAEHYCRATRLEEVALLAGKLGVERIGIAFCIGLAEEARSVAAFLSKDFEVRCVCCKVGGVSKDDFGLRHLRGEGRESTCNPAGQAEVLRREGTGLNVVVGLCAGHDAQFYRCSRAPVVTLAAKDRVLGHAPLLAVYSGYHRRRLGIDDGPAPGPPGDGRP
jgi:uncharacterized metal-binding protein